MVKSNSKQTPSSNFFPIGLYKISYQMEFLRGAKREIRDDKGKLIFSARQCRTVMPYIWSKDEVDYVMQSLREQNFKNVKKKEFRIDLPRKCPRCKNKGSPKIVKIKKTFTPKHKTLSDEKKAKLYDIKLHYGHSTTKPETCEIGHIFVSPQEVKIKLNSKLKIDSLGYRRRTGVYDLPPNFQIRD